MGAFTLVVYLFHGFFVKGAQYAGYGTWADAHPVPSLVLTSVAAVALSLLLAWHPVASRLGIAVDPLGYGQQRVGEAMDLTVAGADHGVVELSPSAATAEPGETPITFRHGD